jgi:hypothetical protein
MGNQLRPVNARVDRSDLFDDAARQMFRDNAPPGLSEAPAVPKKGLGAG